MIQKLSALVLLATVLSSAAFAHDFWLQPSAFDPAVGERVDVQLVVGEHFVGDFVGRNADRIVAFTVHDARGVEAQILGIGGRAPAGIWRAEKPGLHVIGYRSTGTEIELDAAKFEAYLVSEGLESVVAERKSRGESAAKGRESYARCAKSFVVAPGEVALTEAQWSGWDRVLGYPLEIVPEVNPCRLNADEVLPVRVLFQGRPLANALVGCMPRSDPPREVRLRTDADGRVRLRPALGGVHLVRVVHMTRAAAGATHDWESQWASLTFALPQR